MIRRFDLVVNDPYPVFDWLENNCKDAIVRKIAYEQSHLNNWYMKVVLDQPSAWENFEFVYKNNIVEIS